MLKKNPRDERYPDLTSAYADQPDAAGQEYEVRQRRDLEEEAHAAPAPEPRNESVVDADSTFDGKYETGRDLRILGTVSGEIVCRGLLTIEQDASAKAKIQASDVEVRGSVEGDLVASGRLLITSTGVITGTIKAATLMVEEGATVRGTVETAGIGGGESEASEPAPRSERNRERQSKNSSNENSNEESNTKEGGRGSGRWNRSNTNREVPSFALVSSEERAASSDRN